MQDTVEYVCGEQGALGSRPARLLVCGHGGEQEGRR